MLSPLSFRQGSSTRRTCCYAVFLAGRHKPILPSDLRQIPDTQEVLLYPDSDVSIVLEILERVQPTDYTDAAKFDL